MSSKPDAPFCPLNIAVLTVSDTRTPDNDTSGDLLADRARQDMEDLGARLFLAPAVARDPATGLSPEGYESRADAA